MVPKRKVLLLLSAYDPETHQAAAEAARTYNWHLDSNVLTPISIIDSWRGDGILCSLTDNKRYAKFIKSKGLPCVDLSSWRHDMQLPRVSADNVAIGRMAAQHFLKYEHRNFAWYASTLTPFGEARIESYTAELAKHRRKVIRIDGRGSKSFKTMAKNLHKLPRPCAILAQNDADAAWITSLALEEGFQVPMDFAILGVDNNPLICEVHSVSLSSIERDTQKIVFTGANLLNLAMDGKKVPCRTTSISPIGVITRSSSDAYAIEDEIVRKTMIFLQTNLSRKIGTPEIAQELGVSRSLLNQRFQQVMPVSIHQTLMKMRLNKASELLMQTTWNLERIAIATGFTHAPHFSNSFKKHYKQSPLSYRKSKSTA